MIKITKDLLKKHLMNTLRTYNYQKNNNKAIKKFLF